MKRVLRIVLAAVVLLGLMSAPVSGGEATDVHVHAQATSANRRTVTPSSPISGRVTSSNKAQCIPGRDDPRAPRRARTSSTARRISDSARQLRRRAASAPVISVYRIRLLDGARRRLPLRPGRRRGRTRVTPPSALLRAGRSRRTGRRARARPGGSRPRSARSTKSSPPAVWRAMPSKSVPSMRRRRRSPCSRPSGCRAASASRAGDVGSCAMRVASAMPRALQLVVGHGLEDEADLGRLAAPGSRRR